MLYMVGYMLDLFRNRSWKCIQSFYFYIGMFVSPVLSLTMDTNWIQPFDPKLEVSPPSS